MGYLCHIRFLSIQSFRGLKIDIEQNLNKKYTFVDVLSTVKYFMDRFRQRKLPRVLFILGLISLKPKQSRCFYNNWFMYHIQIFNTQY